MPTPTTDPEPGEVAGLPPHPDAPHHVPPAGPRPAEPAPTLGADGGWELVPAGMIGELAYCPRLFTMQWLHDEFADNHHTVEGRMVHKRVDKAGRAGLSAPPPAHDPELDEDEDAAARAEAEAARPKPVRSVKLSDAALGLIAVCDVVEERWDGGVVPIDYKKGKAPDPTYVPEGAYEPERVQVAAQALLLRAHGYPCEAGVVWYAGSRTRVEVPITPELEARVLALRDEARALAAKPGAPLPPPLIDSPKCRGCSLVGICLPDEVNLLLGRSTAEVRPLVPARDDGVSVHVVIVGGSVGKSHEELVFKDRGKELARHRVREASAVTVWGNVSVSSAALALLAEHEVPLSLHSLGGWYQGSFVGPSAVGALLRIAQHEARQDPARRLAIAAAWVRAKIRNQRVLLRRTAGDAAPSAALREMKALAEGALSVTDLASLLGVEGAAARAYFGAFTTMLKGPLGGRFELEGRNRRPPKDPVNCLLSFAYACLARECDQALRRVGFDVGAGFLHEPRHGRPALALDLMEAFRPVIGDSVVIGALNRGILAPEHFLIHPTGVAMTDAGRRAFLQAWELRLDELATHPTLGTRCSMRRMIELDARLLARHLQGELPTLPVYQIR
jgi:CRISPR-associated protein Cas1